MLQHAAIILVPLPQHRVQQPKVELLLGSKVGLRGKTSVSLNRNKSEGEGRETASGTPMDAQ